MAQLEIEKANYLIGDTCHRETLQHPHFPKINQPWNNLPNFCFPSKFLRNTIKFNLSSPKKKKKGRETWMSKSDLKAQFYLAIICLLVVKISRSTRSCCLLILESCVILAKCTCSWFEPQVLRLFTRTLGWHRQGLTQVKGLEPTSWLDLTRLETRSLGQGSSACDGRWLD